MGAGASSRVPLKKLSDGTLSAVQTLPAEAQQELLDWAAPRTPREFFDDATLATAAAPSPEADAAVTTQADTGQPPGVQADGPPPTAEEEAATLAGGAGRDTALGAAMLFDGPTAGGCGGGSFGVAPSSVRTTGRVLDRSLLRTWVYDFAKLPRRIGLRST